MLGIPTCAAGAFANMAKASRATLEAELREVTTTIRWHRQHQVQSAKRDWKRSWQRPFGLTPYREQLVAAIYVLSEFDTSLAAQKLISLRSTSEPSPNLGQARRLVEDVFISMPENFAELLYGPPPDLYTQRLVAAARAYIAEAATRDWVEKQNEQHGDALHYASARAQYEPALSSCSGAPQAEVTAKSARQWVKRWRRRWGVKRGKLKTRDVLSPGLLVDKVAWLSFMDRRFLHEELWNRGPVFEPAFRAHLLIPYKAKGLKRGPFSGPIIRTDFGIIFNVFGDVFVRFSEFTAWPPIVWERLRQAPGYSILAMASVLRISSPGREAVASHQPRRDKRLFCSRYGAGIGCHSVRTNS